MTCEWMRSVSTDPKTWCRKKARYLAVYRPKNKRLRSEHVVCDRHSSLSREYLVTPLVVN